MSELYPLAIQLHMATQSKQPQNPSARAIDQMFASAGQDQWTDYLYFIKYYISVFGYIPDVIELQGIDVKRASAWFFENHPNITDRHNYITYSSSNKVRCEEDYAFIHADLMLHFDGHGTKVHLLFKQTDRAIADELSLALRKFTNRGDSNKGKIKVLAREGMNINLVDLEVKKPRLSIADNYNDDILPVHKVIVSRLRKKSDKGIVLLHGKPGTGKTSYLRYLITQVKKEVIFLPPDMAPVLNGPDFIGLLMEHPDSILVIEDAENVIVDRERSSSSPVAALLNLSDGLLSDCLNIQIVCTFNTNVSRVDDALLRKGRLIAQYEFLPLQVAKANALAAKLNLQRTFTEETNLTEIYNADLPDANAKAPAKAKIGFVKR